MKRLVWTSDLHLGLMTNDINRTDEIVKVCLRVVKYAVKNKVDWFVFGGDIFNNNNPNEWLISQFIRILNPLKKANIKTFVIDGNHDKISKPGRMSCLQFLKKIKEGYPNIKWVNDINVTKVLKSELGDVYFTFLPHISTTQTPEKFKTVQQYIDARAKAIQKKLPKDARHYVFSHLNVKGVIPGSEEYLLKKSEIFLPDVWTDQKIRLKEMDRPEIIQGHIHSRGQVDNIQIVGSPIFVDFGEKEFEKYFLEVEIPELMGEGSGGFKYHKTKCIQFLEFEFSIDNIITPQKVVDFVMKELLNNYPCVLDRLVLKLSITCSEQALVFPFEELRKELMKKIHYVKPITPKIKREQVVRNRYQKPNLAPTDAVKTWFDKNRPANWEHKEKLAVKFIEEEL